MTEAETIYRSNLEGIASRTRHEIGKAIVDDFFGGKLEAAHQEAFRALFRASITAVSRLIEYGEIGPTQDHRLAIAIKEMPGSGSAPGS